MPTMGKLTKSLLMTVLESIKEISTYVHINQLDGLKETSIYKQLSRKNIIKSKR